MRSTGTELVGVLSFIVRVFDTDDFFHRMCVQTLIRVAQMRECPCLTTWTKVIDGNERFGAERFCLGVNHVNGACHNWQKEITANSRWARC